MKLIITKILIVIFCIPMYFVHLVATKYEKMSYYGGNFNFKEETKFYWGDVRDALKYKNSDRKGGR